MTEPHSPLDAFDLPPVWPESLLPAIRAANEDTAIRLVVLDDDPLGGQCVHDVPVLTDWDPHLLAKEIERSQALLLLTNTRALSRKEAKQRTAVTGMELTQASYESAHLPAVIWRSDSTLRGHFWHEMTALAREFPGDGMPEPIFVFIPYFGDGGRYTINDTQYVLLDGALVPAAEAEFARDPVFAFQHSYLPTWLEAHSGGEVSAGTISSISIDDLRVGGPGRAGQKLQQAPPGSAVIVNAADDRDLEVFVAGLQLSEAQGGYFLCSGTASFVRVRAGIERRPLIEARELQLDFHPGGLTIVGSYVDKSTAQLERALAQPAVRGVQVPIEALGDETTRSKLLADASVDIATALANGEDVVLHTPRDFTSGASSLLQDAIASIMAMMHVRPRYLLCKGGSTASHVATNSLSARRATVLGQLQPGVPIWRLEDESRWPGLPFIIFAGNIGGPESLVEALESLRQR